MKNQLFPIQGAKHWQEGGRTPYRKKGLLARFLDTGSGPGNLVRGSCGLTEVARRVGGLAVGREAVNTGHHANQEQARPRRAEPLTTAHSGSGLEVWPDDRKSPWTSSATQLAG